MRADYGCTKTCHPGYQWMDQKRYIHNQQDKYFNQERYIPVGLLTTPYTNQSPDLLQLVNFRFVPPMKGKRNAIYWFRKALRLHDNPALLYSLRNSQLLYPVFVLDPFFVKSGNVGPNRWRFLFQSLNDLDQSLRKYNSRLFLLQGKPQEILPAKIKEWKINLLCFQNDTQPYSKYRDTLIKDLCKDLKVQLFSSSSHTLYDLGKLFEASGKNVVKSYGSFIKLMEKVGPPQKPIQAPSSLIFQNKLAPIKQQLYRIPNLKDIGIDQAKDCGELLFIGGQKQGLKRMQKYLENKKYICEFQKPNTSPNSIKPSTTVLSPYLKFGNISPRLFYHRLKQVYKQVGKHSLPPVSLQGQLIWRQFFYFNAAYTPNFDKIQGNPICKQIVWDNNKDFLSAWKNGKTGYPFIDAIMIQLKQQGWIHHLARHAVACFLTRGDLYISWQRGKQIFEYWLLDADWSLNAANWMWLSASAFFYQYFRVYSPISFGKKTDPNGEYIKKYIPVLSKYPAKYIYEPWKAPLNIQKDAKCIIGVDYPFPIVDHTVVSKKNMERMSKYYGGKQGEE